MKLQALSVSILAAMLVQPVLANDPTMSNTAPSNASSSATGPRTMSPSREKYTRKRVIVLKQQMHDYGKAQKVADKLDLMLGRFPTRSPEAERRYMINRFEYLALKAERGRATRADLAEMQQLQHTLLGR